MCEGRIMYKRFMVFIDGTNFLSQIGRELEITFDAQKPPLSAFDIAAELIRRIQNGISSDNTILQQPPVRSFWFGSYQGDEDYHIELIEYLRLRRFEPVLFKARNKKEKGVDIALTREMLLNAFQQNYEIGLVIAGDEDYLELINDVKRFGIQVYGSFFQGQGLSRELKLTFDYFRPMNDINNIDEFMASRKEKILKEVIAQKKENNQSS
jgi:uncharacterized LabA/DUF88 family protein